MLFYCIKVEQVTSGLENLKTGMAYCIHYLKIS